MAKIMLVEDDNNLREIYEARLMAEGYEIVSAEDGEEALALAVKERPDLIISDVMMPKISGFDMLDILRTTPETRDTKVIMMTALSQAEDKARADKLGADRYLVKSQVTLEDVARVANEVLTGVVATPDAVSSEGTNLTTAIPAEPTGPAAASIISDDSTPANDTTVISTTPAPVTNPPVEPSSTQAATVPQQPAAAPAVILAAPPPAQPQITSALTPPSPVAIPSTQTTTDEQHTIDTQIADFVEHAPVTTPVVEEAPAAMSTSSSDANSNQPPQPNIQELRPAPQPTPPTQASQASSQVANEPAQPGQTIDPGSIAL